MFKGYRMQRSHCMQIGQFIGEHCPRTLYLLAYQVPMIGFKYDGIDIDLLFARLPRASVPQDLTLADDEILRNVDEGSTASLNGPRTTDLIMMLVPNHERKHTSCQQTVFSDPV